MYLVELILMKKKGFTLIELLVVIGILMILVSITVIAINPFEQIRQSKDTKRIAEINAIGQAIRLGNVYGLTVPTGNIVYTSLPDSSSTCGSYTLPSLEVGWIYSCSSLSNYKNTDGTGWIPIDFSLMAEAEPFFKLPIDVDNIAQNGAYYTFISTSSKRFLLSALIESNRFKINNASKDDGIDPLRYELFK